MAVQVVEPVMFEGFLDELRRRPAIRVVKLADFGFAGRLKTSTGAYVYAPQLRIVATAFDKATDTLVRWNSVRQPPEAPSVAIETIAGDFGDVRVVAEKNDLRTLLEMEGYSVSNGQWTPEEIDRLLARRQAVS